MDNDKPKQMAGPGLAFFAVGLVFFVLGLKGRSAFLGIGIAFFTLGIVFMAKARKNKDPAP